MICKKKKNYIFTVLKELANMKKIIIPALATICLFIAIAFNACKPDKCKNVSCAYSGVCKDGACLCQVGYEGEHCETVTRDKFKGIWNVNEDGTLTSAAQYSVSIENGPQIDKVVIKNFQNKDELEVVTAVAYKDTLTIPTQIVSNGCTVEGWAAIVDTDPLNQHYYQHAVMTMYYKVTSTGGQVNEYGMGGAGPSIWSK